MTRLATAVVLATLLWVMIKRAPGWVFFGFAVIVVLAACWELYRMLRVRGAAPFTGLGMLATAVILASFLHVTRPLQAAHALVGASLVVAVLAIWRRPDPVRMLEAVAYTLFPPVFVGLTMGHVIGLREMPAADGSDLVLLLFICVIFGDTAAFYVGRTIGRRRLAPRISPKKTWEGAVGALVGSMIGALVAHVWFYQSLPLSHALALGPLLGLAGIVGDLSASVVKRACGVKDSSDLLPGHGGVLDRTDNLLFAAPILYYYHMLLLRGPV